MHPTTWRNQRAPRQAPGFTLVELMVTIAIVGMLVSVVSPAVQAARESARRLECKNNLKQLSLACVGHHDVHGHFPSGGWGWYWIGDADRGFSKDQPGGWIFNLLPYFEEYAIYDQASDGDPYKLTRKQRGGAAKIVSTPLSVINCPSRRPNIAYPLNANEGGDWGFFNSVTPVVAGRSDYAINSGHVYNEWPNRDFGRGPSSYQEADRWTASHYWGGEQDLANRNLPDGIAMSGVSFERSVVPMRRITDGLSNTYLIGERHIPQTDYMNGYDYGDNETWCTGFNNDNYRKTGRLEGGQIVELAPVPDNATDRAEHWGRFGSAHQQGWNVAYCDGSVREVSYEIDWRVHRDRGNRQDGATTLSR
ncbi:hypothetical protein Mal64_08800 [Pseudobythopirellula maris]|uniref:DUF1559 domain-containing protein n=1 Tax=Pseudobythopirellula maris TaxID=2527991 RepID=A0A5C5ZSK4_9BACT|nr:DUF1559 domain-containing protein [Pseudobythopirellula maris]TWT90489.1 hypothetical protein Mal64_08800 [Pseudobythopirellula maris]